ncbi:hypothetical protein GE09DRAFT_1225821 [Coniochaeta sp. 2T2.1]|nr:hypothetical protein GE09DRAFT_1225821 [Coniochaeta sp. 2T2.1]
MVQYYNIFGRQVGSHYLSMAILATMFGGTYAAFSGPSKAPAASPPINASSSDEADFIKYGNPSSSAAAMSNLRRDRG